MEASEKKALLHKYLQGNCTPEELDHVKQLLEKEADSNGLQNQLMTEIYAAAWEEPESPDRKMPIDIQRVKAGLALRIASAGKKADRRRPGSIVRIIPGWKRVAVWTSIILLSGLGYLRLKKNRHPLSPAIALIEKINTGNRPQPYMLPDSSVVYLGAGAAIRYGRDYGRQKRELSLDGQAFFDVAAGRQPFTIVTGQIHTTVLGTSFKVDAFQGQPLVVAVATGKVAVTQTGRQQTLAVLTPGKKLCWDAVTQQATAGDADIDGLQQWKTGDLVFDNLPLGIVFKEIENRYRWKITVSDPALENYRVNGTFPAGESIARIIKILSHSGKFTYHQTGDSTFIVNADYNTRNKGK